VKPAAAQLPEECLLHPPGFVLDSTQHLTSWSSFRLATRVGSLVADCLQLPPVLPHAKSTVDPGGSVGLVVGDLEGLEVPPGEMPETRNVITGPEALISVMLTPV